MTEYQRERFNKQIRSAWESYRNWEHKAYEQTDPKTKERMERRSAEQFGIANGMREAALILGYAVGTTEDGIPCIGEKWTSL